MRRFLMAIGLALMLVASACGSTESDVIADGDAASSSNDGSNDEDGSTGSSGDGNGDSGGDDDPADDQANDPADDASDDDEPDPDFSGSDSDDFCDTAREFEEDDPLADLNFFDGERFFDEADKLWNGILPDVPDEIRPDVETIIANFQDMRSLMEKYDYDVFNEELATEMDALDTTGTDEANARFDAYLENVCGITSVDTDGSDIEAPDLDLDPSQIGTSAELIAQIFNLDMETAECLVEEFGDVTDPGAIDITRLDEPICGTTLNEVFTGAGGG